MAVPALSEANDDQPMSPHSPFSAHSHLSPRLLTPENDIDHAPLIDKVVFAKQSLPVTISIPSRRSTSVTRGFPRTRSAGTDTDGLSDDPSCLSGVSSGFPDTPRNGSPSKHGQVSLLTALLSSPEHQPMRRTVQTGPPIAFTDAHPNALSSIPSSALSSPTSAHGILQRAKNDRREHAIDDKPHSILRRESISAAEVDRHDPRANTGLSVGSACLLERRLKKVEEKRESVGWADKVPVGLARVSSATSSNRPCLKFAVAKPQSHGSTSASEAEQSRRSSVSHRPPSPFAKERKMQESLDEGSDGQVDEEEEDDDADDGTEEESPVNLPGYIPTNGLVVEDDASDAGYEEDEEDGMFSDEEETTAFNLDRIKPAKFPFARSTNYWNRRESREDTSPGTSPPPAPAFIPPPNRRGRGHIRMAEQPTSGKETKGCSRHCSPPPRSRSTNSPKLEIPIEAPPPAASPSARRMKRPFDPVRKGKVAGSPMPPRVAMDDEEEEDASEESEEEGGTPVVPRGGWRSDDAVFYGPNSRVSRANAELFPPAAPVFSETEDETNEDGVRGFLRRASEHLPILRRPTISLPAPTSGHESERSTPIPVPTTATCLPILDDTPALASSARAAGGGLTHRLEKTLGSSITVAQLSRPVRSDVSFARPANETTGLGRTASLGSGKVTFAPSAPTARRSVSQAMGNEIVREANRRLERITPLTSAIPTGDKGDKGDERMGNVDEATPKVKSLPMKCPKAKIRDGDLGWTEGALLSIRKNVNKPDGRIDG